MNEFNEVIKAWQVASRDLKISIKTPFIVKTISGKLVYPLLVENFGHINGTIILNLNDTKSISASKISGFYLSFLNPELYDIYNKQKFIDTLEDWGYYGVEETRPAWFTGKYYDKN